MSTLEQAMVLPILDGLTALAPLGAEVLEMKPGQTIFTYLHLAAGPALAHDAQTRVGDVEVDAVRPASRGRRSGI